MPLAGAHERSAALPLSMPSDTSVWQLVVADRRRPRTRRNPCEPRVRQCSEAVRPLGQSRLTGGRCSTCSLVSSTRMESPTREVLVIGIATLL